MAVSKNVSSKLTGSDLFHLKFVGTALPGTNKKQRGMDIQSSSILTKRGFENISSAGGFTVLGKNAFGQDVARDNTTGGVATVKSFNPISPEARGIGEQKSPQSLSTASESRRKRTRTGSGTSTGKKSKNKNVLGTSTILGSQSILG